MKRAHRTFHILIWLLLAPAMIALLLLAVMHRPADPINDALPAFVPHQPAGGAG